MRLRSLHAEIDKKSRVASASTMPRFGVWDPCENPGLHHNDRNVYHGPKGKADERKERNCGTGVCRDLRRARQATISTEHRGSCSWRSSQDLPEELLVKHKVVEGEHARCVLWLVASSCACPPHCRIETCGVVSHASKNDIDKLPRGRAVCCTCDAGHTVQGGVLMHPLSGP